MEILTRLHGIRPGEWIVECERCGREIWSSEARKEWTGLIVCQDDYDARHPQEYVRGRSDRQRPSFLAPEPPDVFVDYGDISLSASTITEGAAQGTVIGTLSVSGNTAPVFTLDDSAGGRFQIVGTQLQAGATATDYETDTSHTVTISALYSMAEDFTITVTNTVSEGAGSPIGLLLILTKAA